MDKISIAGFIYSLGICQELREAGIGKEGIGGYLNRQVFYKRVVAVELKNLLPLACCCPRGSTKEKYLKFGRVRVS